MRHIKIAVLLVSVAALAIVPACGGGGRGFRVPVNPLTLASNVFPALLSGQAIEYELPIGGGCGNQNGPYILNLIAGSLPEGVTLDAREAHSDGPGVPPTNRRHISGIALEDGTFTGTIEVIDTSCTPFASLRFDFNWTIGQGPVDIVAANPALIDAATYVLQEPAAFPGIDAIAPVIFNQFGSINLIAAGGVPPYSCSIVDDPLDPDDGQLPLGTSMPPFSCSLVGAPVEVGPNGMPFKLTIRVTDSVGNTADKKFQWKIRTPPIIFGTLVIGDGIAGTNYGEIFQIADGVPPFDFEFDTGLPSPNDNTDNSWTFFGGSTEPTIPGRTVTNQGPSTTRISAAGYPAEATVGPYTAHPPEGLVLDTTGTQAGSFTGVPRRIGQFTIFAHAYSSLVPNESGQHAWKDYTFNIVDSEAAPIIPFGINPSFTVQGVLNTGIGDTYPDVPEFSVFSVYNPDPGNHTPPGLQMLGEGGVAFDGEIDTPHSHTAAGVALNLTDSDEVLGNYTWELIDWDVFNTGNDPIPQVRLYNAPAGAETAAFSDGVLNVDDPNLLQAQSRQVAEFRMIDEQLPTGTTHSVQQRFGLSVGPDSVIITESATSSTNQSDTSQGTFSRHDDQLLIKKLTVVGGSPTIAPLDQTRDMVSGHVMPADAFILGANPLGQLLSRVGAPAAPAAPLMDPHSIDLLRGVVNPGGWWDDMHGLHPKGGHGMAHTSANAGYDWQGDVEDSVSGYQPTASAVALPDATGPGAAHSPNTGVYTDGGKLYPFEKDGHFGVFVIRKDSKIYVPFASNKSTYTGFGDGMITTRGPNQADRSNSVLRTVQMCISPNGRYAAMKLKQVNTNLTEAATSSAVVVFTLDGSKPFAGLPYRVIGTGAGGSLNGVLYATSMVMTDSYLYFLIGEDFGSFPAASWQDHFVMRYEILGGGAAATEAPGPSGAIGPSGNWTQNGSIGIAQQTPFHHWNSPTANITAFTFTPTFGSISIQATNNERYAHDGWNMTENSVAPIPFRVSADGSSCALLAGQATTSTSGSQVWEFYAWVDKNGAGFRQASATDRKARAGAARPHRLRRGSNNYRHWGNYEGPSGGFEINDDGTRIATTFSTQTSIGSTFSAISHNLGLVRQDIVAAETTNDWVTFTEYDVTSDKFVGLHKWKFGGLCFGPTGDRLFFWGGTSWRGTSTSDSTTTSTSYGYPQSAGRQVGTYYMFNFNATTEVRSMFATGDGGTGFNTYTSGSPFSPSTSVPVTGAGKIQPVGGFVSRNQDFLYILAGAPLTTTDGTINRLLAINMSGGVRNGHVADRGFAVENWPGRRGFIPVYHYDSRFAIATSYYSPAKATNTSREVMAKDTGHVFFASHNQYQNVQKSNSNNSNFSGGPLDAAHWQDYGTYDGHIEAFHADVGGPIQRLTQPGLSDPTPGSRTIDANPRTNRGIQYLEVAPDGTRLAYMGHTGGTTVRMDLEFIGYIHNISFEADGDLSGSFNPATDAVLLEGNSGGQGGVLNNAQGRAGSSMALDSSGKKLYYAFRSTGNENLKQLVEVTIDGGDIQNSTAIRAGAGSRFNVLHSGR